MRTISQVVTELISNDTIIEPLGRQGLINVSKYAETLKATVEAELMVDVSSHSIQMALNRYFKSKDSEPGTSFSIQGLMVHAGLAAISFDRTIHSSKVVQSFYAQLPTERNSFVTVTQGINEVTIIADSKIAAEFNNLISDDASIKTIYYIENLVGVTAKTDIEYVSIPNYFHSLISRLALKNINIVESVSTATETTFIVTKQDLQATLNQLHTQLK